VIDRYICVQSASSEDKIFRRHEQNKLSQYIGGGGKTRLLKELTATKEKAELPENCIFPACMRCEATDPPSILGGEAVTERLKHEPLTKRKNQGTFIHLHINYLAALTKTIINL
jgi:hypothetical protein